MVFCTRSVDVGSSQLLTEMSTVEFLFFLEGGGGGGKGGRSSCAEGQIMDRSEIHSESS